MEVAVRTRARRIVTAVVLAVTVGAAGLLGVPAAGAGTSTKPITLGYSAWPGWFPLAVAEKAGIFEDAGVNVKLRFFADYIGSLDAMAAGRLDGNTQTLNDTMAGVAAGSKQVIVVVNDNSAGNDAIICDQSIKSIADMRGKTIAAEQGVVDHFLLLQGLQSVGMTEDDVDFRGVLTDAAAAGFANGRFDCVGVFAPFTLQALERPGSHVVFDSADFPGLIPDHIVVSKQLVKQRPEDVQRLVEAWYQTLDYIKAHPSESLSIMANAAQLSATEYHELAGGTKLFTVQEALKAFTDGSDTTSLMYTAKLINPFMVKSGLAPKKAPLKGLFDPSFTQAYATSSNAP
jgi:NitT/TauT family transport system substrate-binding protein